MMLRHHLVSAPCHRRFIRTACENDPNEDDEDHCPAGQSITDPDEGDWEYPEGDDGGDQDDGGGTGDGDQDAGGDSDTGDETEDGDQQDYDPDEPAFSGVASSPLSSGPALAALAMLMMFGVRRRRRRQ